MLIGASSLRLGKYLLGITVALTAVSGRLHAQPAGHALLRDERAIEHAEIVLPNGSDKTLRAYLVIWNGKEEPADLSAVTSVQFRKIAVHRTVTDQGISRSHEEQRALMIPQRSELVMAPDGIHLKFEATASQLQAGQMVPLNLLFGDGTQIPVDAIVLPAGSTVTDHHHGGRDNVSVPASAVDSR